MIFKKLEGLLMKIVLLMSNYFSQKLTSFSLSNKDLKKIFPLKNMYQFGMIKEIEKVKDEKIRNNSKTLL